MELKVRDLYEGAYLLCQGFHLKHLTIVDSRGKPKAVFIISGDRVEEQAEAYRTGQATVNVALLKFTLEKLKDEMFTKIRAEQALRSEKAKARSKQNDHRNYQAAS